jgi:hypothetical protein
MSALRAGKSASQRANQMTWLRRSVDGKRQWM